MVPVTPSFVLRRPWVPYVVPFAALVAWLELGSRLAVGAELEAALRVGTLAAITGALAWPVLRSCRLVRPVATVAIGVGVFALWIAPDLLVPGYRDGLLFQNDLTGMVGSSMSEEARDSPLVLALRFARAALIVPVAEELFWRGWLPRWLDRMEDFEARPLGSFTGLSFVGTAVLFALEHGPRWDVGLAAGLAFNWWMLRTRSLGDLILCHGVTNACLGGYVLAAGRWEYW